MADFIFNVPKGMKLQQVQGAPSQPPMQMPMPQHQAIELSKGEYLFVLGANGTGKSSLMLSFYGPNQQQARRIVSHRQNWFQSGSKSDWSVGPSSVRCSAPPAR